MKKNNFFIVAVLMIMLIPIVSSCSDDDPIFNTFTFVDEVTGQELSPKKGSKELAIKTTATANQITIAKVGSQNWCTLTAKGNEAFVLNWVANDVVQERTASFKITIIGVEQPVVLNVKQLAKVVNTFELVNVNRAKISVEDTYKETEEIAIKTSATKQQITIKPEGNQDWCTLTVKTTEALEFTTKANESEEDRVAKFKVVVEGKDEPQEIEITQLGTKTEHTLKIEGLESYFNGYNYMFNLDNSAVTLEATITTNVSRWTIDGPSNPMNPSETVSWCEFSPKSGKSGEKVTITIKALTSGTRNCTFSFVAGKAGINYNNIMQSSPATKIKVIENWGKPALESPYVLKVDKLASGKTPIKFIYQDTDGSISCKIYKAGTTEVVTDSWLDVTNDSYQIFMRKKENTTGKERSCDAVIMGGTKELFRFKVIQGK